MSDYDLTYLNDDALRYKDTNLIRSLIVFGPEFRVEMVKDLTLESIQQYRETLTLKGIDISPVL